MKTETKKNLDPLVSLAPIPIEEKRLCISCGGMTNQVNHDNGNWQCQVCGTAEHRTEITVTVTMCHHVNGTMSWEVTQGDRVLKSGSADMVGRSCAEIGAVIFEEAE